MILALVLACRAATPPPAPDPLVPPSRSADYAAWLATQTIDRRDFHEERRWRIGGWEFYALDGPFLDHPAGVGPAGVAARDSQAGWYELLGLPVADAAPRAAWLLGNPIPLTRADPTVPGATVADPALVLEGNDRVLTLWVAWPPRADDPYRVVIRARPDHTATIDESHWSDVK